MSFVVSVGRVVHSVTWQDYPVKLVDQVTTRPQEQAMQKQVQGCRHYHR